MISEKRVALSRDPSPPKQVDICYSFRNLIVISIEHWKYIPKEKE